MKRRPAARQRKNADVVRDPTPRARAGTLVAEPEHRSSRRDDPVHRSPFPAGWSWDRAAAVLIALWLAVMLWVALPLHPTPFYSVESDTIGEYIPAARELRHGQLEPGHYASKGFGYPLLLAGAGALAGGDDYLAARLLNVLAGAAGAIATYLLFKNFLGPQVSLFTLLALLLNHVYPRLTIEAATDVPTFALLIAATLLLIYGRRPWTLFASGLLAGYAIITRYNCLFLPLAAALVLMRRGQRLRSLALYAAGLALPLGAWIVAAGRMGIDAFGSDNVFNVAYEIYGRSMTPEVFGASAGKQFHTFWDVFRYRPGVFVSRLATNLGTRWLDDIRNVLPLWLGVLAVPGMVFGWWRRPNWPAMAIHFGLYYAALSTVFYLPRFRLYLIPFYLSGVVALALVARWPSRRARPGRAAPEWVPALRTALLAVVLLVASWRAVGDIRLSLDIAPHETRAAGPVLARLARPGDRVMARKPNAAYFAGMDYVPLPDLGVADFPGLLDYARETRTRFLFFSVAEKVTRPQFSLLAYPEVNLPGLRQVAYRRLDPKRYFAVYEVGAGAVDSAAVEDGVIAALRAIAEREPGLAWARWQLGLHYFNQARYQEALAELNVAEQLNPRDRMTARLQIEAHERLGHDQDEAAAAERALRIGSDTGFERAALGWARIRQGRFPEAVELLTGALRIDPGNLDYRYLHALALLRGGQVEQAMGNLNAILALAPGHARTRVLVAREWRRQGRAADALAMLAEAKSVDPSERMEVRALEDSLRFETGRSR